MAADAAIFRTHHLTDEQGDSHGIELKLLLQVAVDFPHRLLPFPVVGIRLALMQQDALDDTILGCNLRHTQQSLVWIAPILIQNVVHPVAIFNGNDSRISVLVEESDRTTLNSHRHDADAYMLRHSFKQRAPKPVGRTKVGISTAEGRHGLAPRA